MASRAEPQFFATAEHFRDWLARHAATATELRVGYWKVGSGKPSMTWSESVDEALCVGWIDGVRQRIDDDAYQIRFTPRRPGSIWSAINIAKVEALVAQGRMQPAGMAAFERRTDAKSVVYAYEQREHPELTPAEAKQFKRHEVAWSYFEGCPPSYRKPLLYWVVSAKKAETRERRLRQLIDACARQERLLK